MRQLAITIVCLIGPIGLLARPPGPERAQMSLEAVSEKYASCEQCKTMLQGLQNLYDVVGPYLVTQSSITMSCETVLNFLGHNSTIICPELQNLYLPRAIHFVEHDIYQETCEIFEFCPAKMFGENDAHWLEPSDPMLSEEELALLGDVWASSDQRHLSNRSGPVTFVQISDVHLDRYYKKGTPSQCGHSICCRDNLTGEGVTGKFGSYKCDASETTVKALLDFIQNLNPAPDFFVYVGDNSPHVLSDTLQEKLTDNMLVYTLLVDKLRHIGPIFPALGNHEAFPTTLYSRPLPDTQSLLRSVSKHWPSLFKVTPDQLANIRKHAFYTTLVMPGLRVLTTNSLYEFMINMYALKSNLDPVKKEQQQFVRQTLEDARRNKEKVIYVSHAKPQAFQTYPSYADELNQLSKDFSDVIILKLFGHEHWDVFLLNRDPENAGNITGVSLAAPSITTYASNDVGVNPSFRQYTLDSVTFQPLDYVQYFINITEANANGVATVEEQYTFTKTYNVSDMSPSSFALISDRIHTNWTYYQIFEANYYVQADDMPKCLMEDLLCRKKLTCETRESKPLAYAACVLT